MYIYNVSAMLIFQHLQMPEYQQNVRICAADIMNKYSEVQSSIVYENMGKLVDSILENEMTNTTRIINIKSHLSYSTNELEPYYMLTVIIKNIDELEKYFNAVYRVLGWNSRAKHFIIYMGREDINRIFELSWEKFIIKLLVLDRDQNLYTYYPLENNNCGRVVYKHFLFNCKDLDFKAIDKVFVRNEVSNFNGCEIKVLATPIVPYVIDEHFGIETLMLKELSKRLNFKLKYVKSNFSYWGYKIGNNYTKMFNEFFERKADVMLGMLVANGSFLYDFDSSIAYTKSDLAFYVPAAQKIHPWKNIMKIYSKSIWGTIIFCSFAYPLVWYFVGRNSLRPEGFNEYMNCVGHVIGIGLCKSMKQPKRPKFRYLFLVWSFYTLIVTSTFESSLMSFLTKPAYEAEINTIEKLVESNLDVGGYGYSKALFGVENQNDLYVKIYNRWMDCELDESCTNRTSEEQDFAALSDVRQINYLTPKLYVAPDGRLRIHQMPVTSSFYIWMLMVKGFPLRDQFDNMIQHFSEYGLLSKWINDVSYAHSPISTIQHTPLSIKHIIFAVGILYVGMFFAIIAFIGEHIHYRMNKRKLKPL